MSKLLQYKLCKRPRKAHAQRMLLKHVHRVASRLEEYRHVEADKVPVPERPIIGDGVAGNLINAGANRLDCGRRRRRTAGTREKVRNTHTRKNARTHIYTYTHKQTHVRKRAREKGIKQILVLTQNTIQKKDTYLRNGDRATRFLFD